MAVTTSGSVVCKKRFAISDIAFQVIRIETSLNLEESEFLGPGFSGSEFLRSVSS